nr:helix-turn-helix domain-containing protein [Paracoccus zhejiangensis]
MKRVDTIARVRRAYYVQKWSVKKIVRELHVSRNTVRKILRTDETDFSYEQSMWAITYLRGNERFSNGQPKLSDNSSKVNPDLGFSSICEPSLRESSSR